MSIFRELYAYRQMLKSLVVSDLRTRYKGSFLGFLWTFLNALLMLAVYSVVFSLIMRVELKHYSIFLFAGILPWTNFSASIINSSGVIIRNANLVKKIYFPREVLPLSVALSGIINLVFGLIVMVTMIFFSGMSLSYNIIYFPQILFIQFLFTLAICLLTSSLTVYFRDMEHILNVVIMAWFYFTPIVFPISQIPSKYMLYFMLNPMKPIIEGYQSIFYYSTPPEFESLNLIAGISILLLLISFAIFRRLNKGFAEEI